MARFACVSVPALGHINPMAALARTLIARGHSVVFVHMADMAPMIARLGLDFEPVGEATHPAGWLDRARRHAARASSVAGLSALARDAASVTDMLCRTLPAALRRLGVDFVLADQNEAAGGLVALAMERPYATVAAALPLNREPGVPSPFVGWGPGGTRWHRLRDDASTIVEAWVSRPVTDVIAAHAGAWRLKRGSRVEDYLSPFLQIGQLVPGLDYPRKRLSRCFHHCGPLRDPSSRRAASAERPTRRAFASFGTLQGHRMSLFERIAEAAADAGLGLTIAHGGLLTERQAERLSRRAAVFDFVDQDEIMAAVDIAIVHGGLNTVLDALARGVPLVVVPLAFEQGAIAARVARSGAGRACPRSILGGRRVAGAVRDVAADPAYRTAAARLSDEIARSGGAARAADLVETVLATGRPAFR